MKLIIIFHIYSTFSIDQHANVQFEEADRNGGQCRRNSAI